MPNICGQMFNFMRNRGIPGCSGRTSLQELNTLPQKYKNEWQNMLEKIGEVYRNFAREALQQCEVVFDKSIAVKSCSEERRREKCSYWPGPRHDLAQKAYVIERYRKIV